MSPQQLFLFKHNWRRFAILDNVIEKSHDDGHDDAEDILEGFEAKNDFDKRLIQEVLPPVWLDMLYQTSQEAQSKRSDQYLVHQDVTEREV